MHPTNKAGATSHLTPTAADISSAPIGAEFAARDCDDLTDPQWKRSILRRTAADAWELWDETKTKVVERHSHEGDHGVEAEFGMYYEFADEAHIREVYGQAAGLFDGYGIGALLVRAAKTAMKTRRAADRPVCTASALGARVSGPWARGQAQPN